MTKGRVVMGLVFFPRGGSAQVTRYLAAALSDAGWSVSLVTGSLGAPEEGTHAATFFAGIHVHYLDYTPAVEAFEAGASAMAAPVPMHASFEDREDAPDVVLAAVDPALAEHLSSAWGPRFVAADAAHADVFHLHHLTPQHDAVARRWPHVPVVADLHGTEIKLIEAIEERARVAEALGTTLGAMPEPVRDTARGRAGLDERRARPVANDALGTMASRRLLARPSSRPAAARRPHRRRVTPRSRPRHRGVRRRARAGDRRSQRRRHRPLPPPRVHAGRAAGARPAVAGRRSAGLGRAGWAGQRVVPGVGSRPAARAHRRGHPLHLRRAIHRGQAGAPPRAGLRSAHARFERPASLLVWGGYPGEWEDDHPVVVADEVGTDGIFFVGWRGHSDLPEGLAVGPRW